MSESQSAPILMFRWERARNRFCAYPSKNVRVELADFLVDISTISDGLSDDLTDLPDGIFSLSIIEDDETDFDECLSVMRRALAEGGMNGTPLDSKIIQAMPGAYDWVLPAGEIRRMKAHGEYFPWLNYYDGNMVFPAE